MKTLTAFLVAMLILTWLMLGKYLPIELALIKIRSNQYTEDYRCGEFSRDLVKELEKRGIQSSVIIGESPTTAKQENIVHAWVGIWFEPQTGQLTHNFKL